MTHDELMQKHHKILDSARYLGVGPGWFPIIDSLCTDLQNLSDKLGHQIKATQVKEKFGGLRFYTGPSLDAQWNRITLAEGQAAVTCDVCGKEGKMRDLNGYMATRCDEHAK